jgi:hypothetical protein
MSVFDNRVPGIHAYGTAESPRMTAAPQPYIHTSGNNPVVFLKPPAVSGFLLPRSSRLLYFLLFFCLVVFGLCALSTQIMSGSHSDLEVVQHPDRFFDVWDGKGLIPVKQTSDLEVVQPAIFTGLQVVEKGPPPQEEFKYLAEPGKRFLGEEKRICGLTPRRFWLVILALLIVIVIAAVGGGVGAHFAMNNKNTASEGQNTSSSSSSSFSSSTIISNPESTQTPTASTPTSSQPSVTTTKVPGPKSTLYRDCPSSNMTQYTTQSNATNSNITFLKLCNLAIINSRGGKTFNIVNEPTTSLNDCIDLCARHTDMSQDEDKRCNAVCWRNTHNTDFPGECFGFWQVNGTVDASKGQWVLNGAGASEGLRVRREDMCDSAIWMDQ